MASITDPWITFDLRGPNLYEADLLRRPARVHLHPNTRVRPSPYVFKDGRRLWQAYQPGGYWEFFSRDGRTRISHGFDLK